MVSARAALERLEAYLAGNESLDEFCAYVLGLQDEYDRMYAADEDIDFSSDLVWFFSAEVFGICARIRGGELVEADARELVLGWVKHLRRGEDNWRRSVENKRWPIQWDKPTSAP